MDTHIFTEIQCNWLLVSLPDAKENPSSYRRCKLALNLENYISFVQF